jgi:hypothetical protein
MVDAIVEAVEFKRFSLTAFLPTPVYKEALGSSKELNLHQERHDDAWC